MLGLSYCKKNKVEVFFYNKNLIFLKRYDKNIYKNIIFSLKKNKKYNHCFNNKIAKILIKNKLYYLVNLPKNILKNYNLLFINLNKNHKILNTNTIELIKYKRLNYNYSNIINYRSIINQKLQTNSTIFGFGNFNFYVKTILNSRKLNKNNNNL